MLLSFEWYIQELKEKEAEEERKLSASHNCKYPTQIPGVVNNAI